MGRPLTIKDPKRLSIVLEADHLARLKRVAHSHQLTLSELIRQTLEQQWPVEKAVQGDMFS